MTKTLMTVIAVGSVLLCVPVPISAQKIAWDEIIANGAARFKVLRQFNNVAVLDKETSLVWERSPGDTNGDLTVDGADQLTWNAAHLHCNNKVVGGRKGWRLPTIQELTSLIDPSAAAPPNPAITDGHPFGAPVASYWSATDSAFYASSAWYMFLGDGNANPAPYTQVALPWCVRFQSGVDAQ